MSFPLTPSKRPHDRSGSEKNGRRKWKNSPGFRLQNRPLNLSPDGTVYRVLCLTTKSGSVIGKGGSVVNQIRQETGAKVRVEETVHGCDERVITIAGSDKESEDGKEQNKEKAEHNDNTGGNNAGAAGHNVENGDKEPVQVEETQSEKVSSSAQRALLLVFESMVEGESDTNNSEGEANKISSTTVFRMLVHSSQVGFILGKGGCLIKKIKAESGAQILILPRDKLPVCASPSDDLLQITGGVDAVRMALLFVSKQLLENPPKDNDPFAAGKTTGPSSLPFGPPLQPEVYPPKHYNFPVQGGLPFAAGPRDVSGYRQNAPSPVPKFHDSFNPGQMKPSPDKLSFRLLCTNEKVGALIGRGGSIVRTLQHETGCDIKILDGVPDTEDRIIVISGPAHPDDSISAAQDAVLRVQSRIVQSIPDSQEKAVLSRLLVPSSQIGCLLGKGGSVISEMRKSSGARIRILGKEQTPKCASKDEEVVQMSGGFEVVQEALLQITSRLRQFLFHGKFAPAMNHPPRSQFPDQAPLVAPSMGRRDHSPPRMFPHFNSPFHKFDQFGHIPPNDERPPPGHGLSSNDQRHPFAHGPPPTDEQHPFPHGLPPNAERHTYPHVIPPNDERLPFPRGLHPNDERPPFPRGLPPNDDRHPFPRSFPSNVERPPFAHGFPPNDERPPFTHSLPTNEERPPFAHNTQKPGMPPPSYERIPSSWTPQGTSGVFDHAEGAQQRGIGGFGSGSQSPVITSSTVDVVVPRTLVPSIYGQEGENLRQIRQISGAKITITEPRPEALETVIMISGTPDQTHAAQSLLQAFVLSGQGSP